MKVRYIQPLTAMVAAVAAFNAAAQSGDSFTITKSTIDGGGTTRSQGGQFTLSGTVGQPDANVARGGSFTLKGGFWDNIVLVQTPGAPVLKSTRVPPSRVVISWPSPSTGFTLQQNTNLSTAKWVTPAETVNDDGTNKFIVISPPPGIKSYRFYRLFKP